MSIKVHLPEMLHATELHEHPKNSNKQSRHMYSELRESIKEQGFDEVLTVVPREEEDGYYIVAGNHRYRAGVAEGMDEFPCVVRDDWDALTQEIELVRRNYVRGAIDKDAFTVAVNSLAEEQALSIEAIQEQMGFADHDVFLEFYKEENDRQERAIAAAAEVRDGRNPQIQMIDDLGLILSAIFEEHGHTVPYSFLIFPAGQKKHLFVAATPSLVKSLTTVAEYCISNHLDINVILGGLLSIGISESNMLSSGETEQVKELGSEGLDGAPLEF